MNFSEALQRIKDGKYMARSGWNGKNCYVHLERPMILEPPFDAPIRKPYLEMRDSRGDFLPWTPSHSDLLADDWAEVG